MQQPQSQFRFGHTAISLLYPIQLIMSMLANIIGFSLVGLAARMVQAGILKKPLLMNWRGHAATMAVFGYAGYWAYRWDERAAVLIAEKRAEISERREKRLAEAQ